MPIGYIVKDNSTKIAELQRRLTEEWSPVGAPPVLFAENAPILVADEQPVRFGTARKPIHLYIIWDDWADLPQRDRSEIIMDAYEATHEAPDVMRVTFAMGLTRAEASKAGLKYQIGQAPA